MKYCEGFSSPYKELRDAVVKAAKKHGVDCWRNNPWPEHYNEGSNTAIFFTYLGYWNSAEEEAEAMKGILDEAHQEFKDMMVERQTIGRQLRGEA